jgi:cytochrome b
MEKILVWDIPTRVGHWLLAAAFILSYVTGDSEERRLIHVTAGYAMAGVLMFRLFWGMAGTRYARFSSFLFSPQHVFAYLGGLLKGKASHWAGHNPAGSYAIFALILLGTATIVSGWAVYCEIGGEWVEETHDVLSYSMLSLVGLHVSGAIASSFIHRENLIHSMIVGCKRGKREDAIASGKGYWVLLLLVSVASASLLTLVT